MADITLAECNGRAWLVGGEDYLYDLLGNTLSKDVSIEFIPCGKPEEVHRLWVQNCGPREDSPMPWQIHPNIVARVRRASPDFGVYFAQWSAMLDADAESVIAAAANAAAELAEVPVRLAMFLDPAGPRAIADLAALRAQLIADRLTERGVAAARIARITRDVAEIPGMAQEAQRIDIVIRAD
ncbi:MAG: hypothetical protein KGI51_08020 [Rhodospirillales bacterium]|nr:hypothetical protein [Rhodospirillales bacterium]